MKQLAIALLVTTLAASSHAAEYLGLDLGVATKEKVLQQLKSSNSPFEDDYGYKGYSNDLPSVKILGYEKFNKLGSVTDAWLEFSPKSVLYRIMVTYSDAGETFKVLKDALDTKYGRAQQQGSGFNADFGYRDGNANITLLRNTFGFGADQKTTLIYQWAPFVGEVNKMKASIEDDIKKKNAKKVGKDL